MEIVVLDSALKHNITEDRILSCLFNVRGDKLLDDPPPKRLLAGFVCIAKGTKYPEANTLPKQQPPGC